MHQENSQTHSRREPMQRHGVGRIAQTTEKYGRMVFWPPMSHTFSWKPSC